MANERLADIQQKIADLDTSLSFAQKVCQVGKDLTQADGVSVALVLNDAYTHLASTSNEYTFLEEEQFSLGQGPSFRAKSSLTPIIIENTMDSSFGDSFPVFQNLAAKHQIGSMFVFPLRVGNAYIGALSCYRKQPGNLNVEEYSDGLILARIATTALVKQLAGIFLDENNQIYDSRVIEQSGLQIAAGMVSEQLNCSIIDALVRIRALAFKEDLPVNVVANKIIDQEIDIEN